MRDGNAPLVAAAMLIVGCKGTEPTSLVRRVVVRPDSSVMHLGQTANLFAQAYDAAGMPLPDAMIRWSVSDSSVVAVSSEGVAVPVQPGRAEVTATADGATGSDWIRVGMEGQWDVVARNGSPLPAVIDSGTCYGGTYTTTLTRASLTLTGQYVDSAAGPGQALDYDETQDLRCIDSDGKRVLRNGGPVKVLGVFYVMESPIEFSLGWPRPGASGVYGDGKLVLRWSVVRDDDTLTLVRHEAAAP
jgi:hypothetical protein